jgi:hypothetical protein
MTNGQTTVIATAAPLVAAAGNIAAVTMVGSGLIKHKGGGARA